ncbi:MAG: c-type cytochrome [Terriglobales bacterium]
MRRVDILGAIGVLFLIAGAGTFLNSYSTMPLWVVWLVGPLLWYLGFAILISWLLWRLFVPAPEAQQEQEEAQKVRASNFVEHDYEVPVEPKMRKVPVYSALAILIILSSVFIAQSYAADNAATTFTTKCAMCHGADGQGKTPMGTKFNIKNLASPEVQKESVAELTQTITKGRNKMPAYEGKLTKDEIAQLAAYVKGLGKK